MSQALTCCICRGLILGRVLEELEPICTATSPLLALDVRIVDLLPLTPPPPRTGELRDG